MEESRAESTSVDIRDGTNPVKINFQDSSIAVQGSKGNRELTPGSRNGAVTIGDCLSVATNTMGCYLLKVFNKQLQLCEDNLFLIYFLSMLNNFSSVYSVFINNEKRCIELDEDGLTTLIDVMSFCSSFGYIMGSIISLRSDLRNNGRKKRAWTVFVVDVLVILPVPQVLLVLATAKRIRREAIPFVLDVLLLQSSAGYMRMRLDTSNRYSVSPYVGWIQFWLLYIVSAAGIGSSSYAGAIKTEIEHWARASKNHTGCVRVSFYCDSSLEATFVNDSCPKMIHDSRLYSDFFQSGVLESKESYQRIFFGLRWGLQNLCTFGQNLQTGPDVFENTIIILIITVGVSFFYPLKELYQFHVKTSKMTKKSMREINQWMRLRNLSEKVQLQVKNHLKRFETQEIRVVNVENLLNNLPKDLRKIVNRELCLELLKKVEELEIWTEASLEELCDCAKPYICCERTGIVNQGDPIDEMLFVLQGKLRSYSASNTATGSPMTDNRKKKKKCLKDGDFCGQELIKWVQTDPSSDLPISTRSVKAQTRVEAFVLSADDLQNVFIKHSIAVPFIQSYWRFRRILRARKNPQTSMVQGTQPAQFRHQAGPEIVTCSVV